jgi:hypothetical protein
VADQPPIADTARRAYEANLHYYRSLGKVTAEYLKALARILGGARPAVEVGRTSARASAAPARPGGAHAEREAATLILEGVAGSDVRGVFAISNDLDREVSAPVMSTRAEGPDASLELRASPPVVTVAKGQRALVEVGTVITEEMRPGDAYRGEISVPGLSTGGIPIIVRRVATAARETAAPGAPIATRAGAAETAVEPRTSAKGRGPAKGGGAKKKAPSKKAPSKKAATTKTARKKTARKKVARKKGAAKKASAKTVSKKAAPKKAAPKKAAPKKAAPKKAPGAKADTKQGDTGA